MKKTFFIFIACWVVLSAVAQEHKPSWQQLWQENMNMEDEDDDELSAENLELLQELADHPLDLNRATRDELERLPFLSAQQVMDFIEYRDRYGPLCSMGEVRMVPSMDYQQVALMPCFCYVGEVKDTLHFPRLKTIARYGRHDLSGQLSYPFYQRKGDRNGYLGYKVRHWLRYEFSYGKYVRLGIVGSQDAGEPFFSHRNRWGYDAYSYYIQVQQLGCLENLVLGKYKLSTGMGLVLNNSFSLGKVAVLQNLGRQQTTVRPHASGSEADYLQGAAAVIRLARRLRLTAFGSIRPLDATLNKDSTVATIITNGYHRTPKEMEKKYNTWQTDGGLHLAFSHQGLHLGATAVYTHLNRSLNPSSTTLYRAYYPRGTNFFNASLNYSYMHHRFSFNGETAIDGNGHVATINALSYQPTGPWSLVAIQRFYSYRYNTLHGHAFAEGSRVQNESGIYLGGTWQPLWWLELKGYADYAYFPWARYRVSQSSSAQDYLGELTTRIGDSWTVKGRYRLRLRKLDRSGSTTTKTKQLRRHNEHRARLSLNYAHGGWNVLTQGDYVRAVGDSITHGWMVSEQLSWQHRWWQLNLRAAYFDTQSYDSRIYTYERQLPHNFSYPMYYGKGLRVAFVASASVGRWLQVNAKLGFTRYFDRDSMGSGLQQIDGSSMTDLTVQLRCRL